MGGGFPISTLRAAGKSWTWLLQTSRGMEERTTVVQSVSPLPCTPWKGSPGQPPKSICSGNRCGRHGRQYGVPHATTMCPVRCTASGRCSKSFLPTRNSRLFNTGDLLEVDMNRYAAFRHALLLRVRPHERALGPGVLVCRNIPYSLRTSK